METIKEPPKKGRGRKPAGPELPKQPDGLIDKEKAKQMFMASQYVEWAPFAQSQGWNVLQTYSHFPTNDWSQEKKKTLARIQAEKVGDQLFNHRSAWHADVLKTLKDYPATIDRMMNIVQVKMNEYVNMINADLEDEKNAAKLTMTGIVEDAKGKKKGKANGNRFSKVSAADVRALAGALEIVRGSKYRSLLVEQWSVKVAEQFSTPEGVMEADEKAQEVSKDWKLQLIGGENVSPKELGRFINQYFDPPQVAPVQEAKVPDAILEAEPEPDATG